MSNRPELQRLAASSPFNALPEAGLVLERYGRSLPASAGEPVIREGELGDTTYGILSGEFEVWAESPTGEVLLAVLGPGAVFGEMGALQGVPRSATVRSPAGGMLLELPAQALERMARDHPEFGRRLGQMAAERSVSRFMETHELFVGVAPEVTGRIAAAAEFADLSPGTVVCTEGEPGDDLYVLLGGFVKVSVGAAIVGYLGAGSVLGEAAVLTGAHRSATIAAFTRVTMLRIPTGSVLEAVQRSEHLRMRLDTRMRQLEEATADILATPAESEILRQAVDLGLVSAGQLLVIDLETCTSCDACVQACIDRHGERRLDRAGVRVARISIPVACRLCPDPVCLLCPYDGIRREASGEIRITDKCIGCTGCVRRCPYDAITMHYPEVEPSGLVQSFLAAIRQDSRPEVTPRAAKCDRCTGFANEACVHNCPVDAIAWVDPQTLFLDPGSVLARP